MKVNKPWTIAFFGVGALWIAMELFAAFGKTGDYMPLTWYIVNFIPAELGMLLITGFCGWLIYHFGIRYFKKSQGKY